MKMVSLNCPRCGATLQIDSDNKYLTCKYCESTFFVDDETNHTKIENQAKEKQHQKAAQYNTQQSTSVKPNNHSKQKKRRTWLWVLGWIFIFPLPLTLLIAKNQKLKAFVKIGIIAVAWIIYLFFVFPSGAHKNQANKENEKDTISMSEVEERATKAYIDDTLESSLTKKQDNETIQDDTQSNSQSYETIQDDAPSNSQSNETINTEEEPIFVEDIVVNQFIIDYNSITNSPITEISEGNIKTKYYFKTYGFRTEIINANSAEAGYTSVSINGNMDSHVPEMRDAFHDVVKTLSPDLSDEEIYSFFDEKTVYGNCAHDTPLGTLICSVFLTGNADNNGRIDIHN